MTEVVGLLLAGGQSRRMGGGDKALRYLGKERIIDRAVGRARGQVSALLINANSEPGPYQALGLPIRGDVVSGFAGPLAGVLTGLLWARETQPEARWMVSFACDTPFFPLDLTERLLAAADAEGADMACAASRGRHHPVFGLWPIALADDLYHAVVEEEIRKVDRWTDRHKLAVASFADVETASGPLDPFFNTNRPEDLAEAEGYLQAAEV